jgi:Flp pilus assembly pilin Flp
MMIIPMIKLFLKEEDGATGIEYALLAALIAGVVIGGQSALSVTLETMYTTSMGFIMTAMAP